jgi:hypothetical protein
VARTVQIGMHVGEQKTFDKRDTWKPNAHGLADDAVGAIGADHPAGLHVGAVVKADGHAVRTAGKTRDASTPFHRSTDGREPIAQCALDLGLRHDQSGSNPKMMVS